ncbi:MAG: glycoside hydrolase family 18 protein, partial [Bacteroidia bacterium]
QERLKLSNPGYELRVTVPLLDRQQVFEFAKYSRIVTSFIVTGYDCYGARNGKPGPSSVLTASDQWRMPDLHMSVAEYIKAGVPANQIVLSLPHFGKEWTLTTNDRGTAVAAVDAIRPYNFFLQPLEGRARFDSSSSTAYRIGTGTFVTRYYWWDDAQSLRQKYAFVKEQGLRGVGIWALGYDNGREELWDLIQEEFADSLPKPKPGPGPVPPRPGPYDPITEATLHQYRWIQWDTFPVPAAFRHSPEGVNGDFLLMFGDFEVSITRDIWALLTYVFLILAVFIELGFWLSLLRSDTREIVFVRRKSLAYLLGFVSTVIPLLVMRSLNLIVPLEWVLVIILLGMLLSSLVSARLVTLYNRPKP